MSKNWQWIPTNERGAASNEESRRRVRENAMRDYRRSERLTRMREHASEQNLASAGTPSTPQGSTANQTQQMVNMPVESLGEPSSALDPFSTTALPNTNDARRILQYFISTITPQLQPLSHPQSKDTLNTILTKSALEDTGAISSILFHASLHRDLRANGNGEWSPLTLHYSGETIRILNERLQSQAGVASDSSICMVGFLAASGNITGNIAAEESHWSALQTMVDMRGGMNGLGWNGALGLILQIGDLIHAAISSAKPKFNAPDVTTNPLTGMMPPSILEQPLDIHDTDSFKAAVTTLVELYAHLSALQSHIFANPSIRTELFLPFTQLSIVLEHRLLSLVKPLHLDAKTALYAAAHITLIMCAFLIFRIFPLRTSVLETLQTRLGPTLIPLDMSIENLLDSKELKMLLWVQWVGALAALEQEWYVARIKESMKALGVSEWDGLKEVLECFVWNARLEDSACWELCDRVGISNS